MVLVSTHSPGKCIMRYHHGHVGWTFPGKSDLPDA